MGWGKEEDMAKKPSALSKRSPAGPNAGPGGNQRDAVTEQATTGGAMADDSVIASSSDPWAETDAGHADESASDSLDQHPQPEDEAAQNPDA